MQVVVYHPSCVLPSEVQEQLQKMTNNFVVKSTGNLSYVHAPCIHVGCVCLFEGGKRPILAIPPTDKAAAAGLLALFCNLGF